jgi:acetyl-CoA carboxylase carboxyltransferase component
LIPLLANSASTPDIGAIIGQAAGGGVAGAVLTAIVGALKNRTA